MHLWQLDLVGGVFLIDGRECKKVTGNENIRFSIAEAALGAPDDAMRDMVFPAATGGEQTLRELVHEFKTKGPVSRRTTLRSSNTGHYRRGLITLDRME